MASAEAAVAATDGPAQRATHRPQQPTQRPQQPTHPPQLLPHETTLGPQKESPQTAVEKPRTHGDARLPAGALLTAALALPGIIPSASAQTSPDQGIVSLRYFDYRDWQP